MESTRRSLFATIAAGLGLAASVASPVQAQTRWNAMHFGFLVSQGASLSFDVQGWDIRQIFAIVNIAKEHGASVTLRSAAVLTPEQAAAMAGPNVTFEM